MCTENILPFIQKFIIEILDNVVVSFHNFASQYLPWIKKS